MEMMKLWLISIQVPDWTGLLLCHIVADRADSQHGTLRLEYDRPD